MIPRSTSVVAGAFVDYAFGNIKGDLFGANLSVDNQFGIGARLGYLLTPKSMLFATTGWTTAKFDFQDFQLNNKAIAGTFVGGGLEQVLSNSWFLKLEYRFSNYRDAIKDDFSFGNEVHSVRLGVNYKFGR
jgi:outer membrane immunogenic protein